MTQHQAGLTERLAVYLPILTAALCSGSDIPEQALQGMSMIKSELARKLAERNPHLYLHHAERIVDVVFDEIINALRDGSRVELRGFGTFSIKSREARKGRNPRTGSSVEIAAKRTPAFRCSKGLHQGLNKPED